MTAMARAKFRPNTTWSNCIGEVFSESIEGGRARNSRSISRIIGFSMRAKTGVRMANPSVFTNANWRA
jgi:hypothetical protein